MRTARSIRRIFRAGEFRFSTPAAIFKRRSCRTRARTVDALAATAKEICLLCRVTTFFVSNKETGETLGKYRVDYASDLAVGLDGKLYVSSRRGEITVLSADGAKLKNIRDQQGFQSRLFEQIAVDGTGNFFLLDGRNHAVFKLSPDGKLLTRFGGRATGSSTKCRKRCFTAVSRSGGRFARSHLCQSGFAHQRFRPERQFPERL